MHISVVRSGGSQAGRIYVWPSAKELLWLQHQEHDPRRAAVFVHLPVNPSSAAAYRDLSGQTFSRQATAADHLLVLLRAEPGSGPRWKRATQGSKLIVGENPIGYWGITNAHLRLPLGFKREVQAESTTPVNSEFLRECPVVLPRGDHNEPIIVLRIKAEPLVLSAEPEPSRIIAGQDISLKRASVSGAGIARLESAVRVINDAAREGTIHSLTVERRRLRIRVTQVIG